MTVGSFPVVYSTLSPQAVVSRVLSCYDIPDVRACQFWNRGLSDVYLVETADRSYILKVSHCHWRCRSDIAFELEFLRFLHANHLPVSYALPTRDGNLFIELDAPEGQRYASLFHYAPGTIALGDWDLSQAHKLGEITALIHKVSVDFDTAIPRPALTLDFLVNESWRSLAPFLRSQSHDSDYVEDAIADINHTLRDLPTQAPYWSVCWGDPHSGNAHFTEDNQPTLFDFDQCGFGWRSFDLGKFRQLALTTGVSRHVREAFLNGYQQTTPLDEVELAAISALTQAAHLWTWAISLTHATHHNYSRLDDSYFKVRLEQLKQLRSSNWQSF